MPDNIAPNVDLLWKIFVFIFGLFVTAFLGLWGLIKSGSKWVFGRQIQRIDENESKLDEIELAVTELQCNIDAELGTCKVGRKEFKERMTKLGDKCDDRFDKVAEQLKTQNDNSIRMSGLVERMLESDKENKEFNKKMMESQERYQQQIIDLLSKQLDKN